MKLATRRGKNNESNATTLRLSHADASAVQNPGGWLTTVVARVCLGMLRSRKLRREDPLVVLAPDPMVDREGGSKPAHEALLAVLDPEVVLSADAATCSGPEAEIRGAAPVAMALAGRGRAATVDERRQQALWIHWGSRQGRNTLAGPCVFSPSPRARGSRGVPTSRTLRGGPSARRSQCSLRVA